LYPGTALNDNLLLAALPAGRTARITRLESIYEKYSEGDTADEVLFMLGKEFHSDDSRVGARSRKAESYLTTLTQKHPESPFYWEAKRMLSEIQAARKRRRTVL
jgi:hypothetical protein